MEGMVTMAPSCACPRRHSTLARTAWMSSCKCRAPRWSEGSNPTSGSWSVGRAGRAQPPKHCVEANTIGARGGCGCVVCTEPRAGPRHHRDGARRQRRRGHGVARVCAVRRCVTCAPPPLAPAVAAHSLLTYCRRRPSGARARPRCTLARWPGVPEDPVTGSAHCCLAVYWAARLQRTRLVGVQASLHGGTVHMELQGDRVLLKGPAVTVAQGNFIV